MPKDKSNFLASLPFPLMWRNFVASGLIPDLCERLGTNAHAISPDPEAALSLNGRGTLPNITVPADLGTGDIPQLKEIGWLDKFLHSIHLTGFAQECPDGSLQNMELSKRRNAQAAVAWFLRTLAPVRTRRRAALRNLYGHHNPSKPSVVRAFDQIRPDFVLVASPGHFWLDFFVLSEARRRGIPSVCIILSWDNLYSRGPLARRPDYLLVWSEEMKRQAIELHQFPEERIRPVGALQFVHYDRPVTPEEIAGMRARIGLAPEEDYLAYVCGARTARYDVEDVVAMQTALQQGPFKNLRIIVRPHPQGAKSFYSELQKRGILLDMTLDLLSSSRLDQFDSAAIRHMAALLKSARFVASSWGTTALLEACILQTPSIQFRWMDAVSHSESKEVQKVRDFQRYLHMRPFDEAGARLYCDHPGDLNATLQKLEREQGQFTARRSDTVSRLVCLPLEGVVNRIGEHLVGLKKKQ